MSIIITHARVRNALAATRSLGRKGLRVITSDSIKNSTSFFSKYSHSRFIYPPYKSDEKSFIKTIKYYIHKEGASVLMPMSEESYVISKYRDFFNSKVELPLPSYEKMIKVGNKANLMVYAKELGVSIPQTFYISDISDLRKYKRKISFPAVIKLVRGAGSQGLRYVNSFEELEVEYKILIKKFNLLPGEYPLIQQYIRGAGWGVSLLFNDGEPRAIFTHRRIREFPTSGGPSTSRISAKHKKMEEYAVKLLKEIEWHGVAMVEFKLDEKEKKPYLMEINPRFWGSLNLAICSGVDFPYLFYKMATDGDIAPVFSYKIGVKSRWLLGELRAFLDYVRNGQFHKLKDFFNFNKFTYFDDFTFDDPKPFFYEALIPLSNLIKYGKLKFQPEEDR